MLSLASSLPLVGGVAIAALMPDPGLTDPPAGDPPAHFAAPKRLRAGDAFVGARRLYPSPVLHDVDGDGMRDLVIGDLFGRVTVARRRPGDDIAYAEEQPLKDRRGERLKFNNW